MIDDRIDVRDTYSALSFIKDQIVALVIGQDRYSRMTYMYVEDADEVFNNLFGVNGLATKIMRARTMDAMRMALNGVDTAAFFALVSTEEDYRLLSALITQKFKINRDRASKDEKKDYKDAIKYLKKIYGIYDVDPSTVLKRFVESNSKQRREYNRYVASLDDLQYEYDYVQSLQDDDYSPARVSGNLYFQYLEKNKNRQSDPREELPRNPRAKELEESEPAEDRFDEFMDSWKSEMKDFKESIVDAVRTVSERAPRVQYQQPNYTPAPPPPPQRVAQPADESSEIKQMIGALSGQIAGLAKDTHNALDDVWDAMGTIMTQNGYNISPESNKDTDAPNTGAFIRDSDTVSPDEIAQNIEQARNASQG